MRKKLIIGFCSMALLFIIAGFIAMTSIERTTAKLDHLVQLHQVEILREQLLLQLKRAQLDLYLKDTRYASSIRTMMGHVQTIDALVHTCFGCHHTEHVFGRLQVLEGRIEDFKQALSRTFTVRANHARLRREEDRAFRIGTDVIDEVNSITIVTAEKLKQDTKATQQEVRRTKIASYIIIAVIPLLAIGIALQITRNCLRPVNVLLDATRRIKAGNLDFRVEELPDEFGELGGSFNAMAMTLREDCVRMQWAEQLMVLGEMAGGFAHEIKNPLAGLKASMDVLSVDHTLGPENRNVVLKAAEQIKRIENLIKTLLNFARPPKPQLMLSDINSVLDSAVALVERHPALAKRTNNPLLIQKDFDPDLPETLADPLQLQQVFMNLLLNAAEAMPESGTITIRTEHLEAGWGIRVRITDTGSGIDESLKHKIFQPFFTTKSAGTGLGLAVAQRLVQQHGGSIRVENAPEGGASFIIILPVKAVDEVALQ